MRNPLFINGTFKDNQTITEKVFYQCTSKYIKYTLGEGFDGSWARVLAEWFKTIETL